MSSRLNTEFNYRYQVIGETPWAKIHTLKGFLNGRIRAAALEEVAKLKYQAKIEELKHLKTVPALPHIILQLEAELIELESFQEEQTESFRLNRKEIACLEKLLDELYAIAEPTRAKHDDGTPFTDDEMHELNAANEFTMDIAKDIQAEIIANGRPSPAKLRNAMSNPHTFNALKQIGLIPQETTRLGLVFNTDITKLELAPLDEPILQLKSEK